MAGLRAHEDWRFKKIGGPGCKESARIRRERADLCPTFLEKTIAGAIEQRREVKERLDEARERVSNMSPGVGDISAAMKDVYEAEIEYEWLGGVVERLKGGGSLWQEVNDA